MARRVHTEHAALGNDDANYYNIDDLSDGEDVGLYDEDDYGYEEGEGRQADPEEDENNLNNYKGIYFGDDQG